MRKNMNTNQTKTSMISKYTIAVNEKNSGAVRSRCLSIHTRNSARQITIALVEDPILFEPPLLRRDVLSEAIL